MSERVVVRAAIAPLHSEARVSSPQVSQQLAGHAVTVLESNGDWLRVQSADGYEGWMHRGYIHPPNAPSLTSDRLSLGCVVRTRVGTFALPLGAWIPRDASIVSGESIDPASRTVQFPRDARAIALTAAASFIGTPYQWGGITPWGADCSGLVQTAFWLHGVQLPRDAWQQAEIGVDAGSDVAAFQAADLLFFSDRADRRITHVGVSLGHSTMVHLALGRGGYAVENLAASDDPYVTSLVSRFVAARRPL